MNKRLAASLVVLVGALLLAPEPAAAGEPCEPAVSRFLERLKVESGDVRRVDYAPLLTGGDDQSPYGYTAWVYFDSCPGSLVVKMNLNCRVYQGYSQGGCEFDGVRSFC